MSLEKVRGPGRVNLHKGLGLRATTSGSRLLRLVEDRDSDVVFHAPGSVLHRSCDLDLVAHRFEPLVDVFLETVSVVASVENLYAFHVLFSLKYWITTILVAE